MRVGWILPWIDQIGANKTVFSVCTGLSEIGVISDILCYAVRSDLEPEVRLQAPQTGFRYVQKSDRLAKTELDYAVRQVSPIRERKLARLIEEAHQENRYDALILVANEFLGLARLLVPRLRDRPLFGLSVMELIDHSFLLRHERSHEVLRALSAPFYPAIHWAWGELLRNYDFLLCNSQWTADMLAYLYGQDCSHLLISLPSAAFQASPDVRPGDATPYIAVPTVSLDAAQRVALSAIAACGVRLVSYGPSRVDGIPHLGYLPEDRMRQVLNEAAATLFLFDYEALGLVPFESLAVGTPVVTLPKGGVFRALQDNPFVSFGRTAGQLADLCFQWLRNPPTAVLRERAVATVEPFRADHAAKSLASFLAAVAPKTK